MCFVFIDDRTHRDKYLSGISQLSGTGQLGENAMSSDEYLETFQTPVNQTGRDVELSIDHVLPPPPADVHADYFFYVSDLDTIHQSWTDDRAFFPSIFTYGLTFILGLIGNALVLVALLGDRKSLRNVTSILMASLAIADLLFPVSYTHLTLPTNREV